MKILKAERGMNVQRGKWKDQGDMVGGMEEDGLR